MFRATMGLLIGVALYAPHGFDAAVEAPWLAQVRTQLVAARPGEKLQAMALGGVARLRDLKAAQPTP